MKTVTWTRHDGHVSVVLFENKRTAAVSTKVYATKQGALGANKRLAALCGANYGRDGSIGQSFPWSRTDPETGVRTELYRSENLSAI